MELNLSLEGLQLRFQRISRPDLFLHVLQLLELRFGRVVFVEGIAAGNHPVARRGGAIAERAADQFIRQRAFLHGFGEHVGITQHHAPQAHHVHPTIAHDVLRDVRQVFLQVAVRACLKKKMIRNRGVSVENKLIKRMI